MFKWTARIHKTGSKVRIYDGERFVKEVKAANDTFAPAEAKEFANELLAELNRQSKTADKSITVRTPADVQKKSLGEVKKDSKGLDPKDTTELQDDNLGADSPTLADATGEVDDDEEQTDNEEVVVAKNTIAKLRKVLASYKNALHQEKVDRVTERKARRGLAIAKQLVANGELKNSYETIRAKVAAIVEMESREIEMLERKVAGEREFVSVTEAKREARRQARIARMNRVAAEDAQEEGDEAEAETLDIAAEEAEAKCAAYNKIADEMAEEIPVEMEDSVESVEALPDAEDEDDDEEEDDKGTECEVVAKKKAKKVKAEELPEPVDVDEDDDDDEDEEDDKGTEEPVVASKKVSKKVLAAKYRRIAAKHRKLAEEAETSGDVELADQQDELADQADEKAEQLEEMQAGEAGAVEMQDGEKVVDVDVDEDEDDEEDQVAEVPEEKQMAEEMGTGVTEDQADEDDEDAEEEQIEPVTEDAPADDDDEDQAEEETDTDDVLASKKAKAKASALKRGGEEVTGFGIDKSASLETNKYAHDTEVSRLSDMWKGAPKD